jgi:hypothetical protein
MECRPNIELAYSKKADGSNSVYAWFSRHPADIVLLQLNASELPLGLTGVLQVLDEIKRWEMGFSVQPVAVVIAGIIGREPEVMAYNRGLQAFVAQKTSAVGTDARDDIIFINPKQVLAYPADFHDRLRPNPMDYHSMAKVWRQALIQNHPLEKCPQGTAAKEFVVRIACGPAPSRIVPYRSARFVLLLWVT